MYLPVQFCKNVALENIPDKVKLKSILMDLVKNEQVDDILFYAEFSREKFMSPDYDGPMKELNNELALNGKRIFNENFGREEIAGSLFAYMVANLWSRDKQVYMFDPELEQMLADTDEVKVPVRILDRVPYRTIYIDFANEGIFKAKSHGAFLHLAPMGDGYLLYVVRLREDGAFMTGASSLVPCGGTEEEDNPEFIINRFRDTPHDPHSEAQADWPEFSMFLLNALLYLCAENAEVRESETTKNTYRPSKVVRNKFSEVRQYECGYVFGSTVRRNAENEIIQKPSQKAEKQACEENTFESGEATTGRTRMRPHVRRAHWHHYWTGIGRTELALRWIAPTPVGRGNMPATVHKCE